MFPVNDRSRGSHDIEFGLRNPAHEQMPSASAQESRRRFPPDFAASAPTRSNMGAQIRRRLQAAAARSLIAAHSLKKLSTTGSYVHKRHPQPVVTRTLPPERQPIERRSVLPASIKSNPVTSRMRDGDVTARPGGGLRFSPESITRSMVRHCCDLFDNVPGGVNRTAVGDHNFGGWSSLAEQAIEQRADRILFVPRRDDDADFDQA